MQWEFEVKLQRERTQDPQTSNKRKNVRKYIFKFKIFIPVLLQNPTVKGVLDILKRIFCDDFQIASGARADSLIDVVIESIAEGGSTRKLQTIALSALVHTVRRLKSFLNLKFSHWST